MKKIISILFVIPVLMVAIGCNSKIDPTPMGQSIMGTWEGDYVKLIIGETNMQIFSKEAGEWKPIAEGTVVIDESEGKMGITCTKIIDQNKTSLQDLPFTTSIQTGFPGLPPTVNVTIKSVKSTAYYAIEGDKMLLGCYKGGNTETLIGNWRGGSSTTVGVEAKILLNDIKFDNVSNNYGLDITGDKITNLKKMTNIPDSVTSGSAKITDVNEKADWVMKSGTDNTITLSNVTGGVQEILTINPVPGGISSLEEGDMVYSVLGDCMVIHNPSISPILTRKTN